jgi:alkyl hydroperoxide reductase subunit AhpC
MPAFNQALPEFDRLNTQVLGISVDSVPCNTAWEASLGDLNYPLLSDFWPHGQVAQLYGVLRTEGYAERALIGIDKTGKIRYIDVHNIADVPDPGPVLQEIAAWK